MLRRKIDDILREWKKTKGTQGLLITGARQIGKTSSIEAFARAEYDRMIKIDFVETPDAVDVIGGARSLDDLIVRITALSENPISEKKTLLFFDEVQRCGDAITWMRYLAKDMRFDVIYSGSMLGVEAYNLRSLPVGTIDIVEMFPLDFEEFCWASGLDSTLWDVVRRSYETSEPVPNFLHEKMIDLWRRYILVGGMPEPVNVYVTTNDTQAFRARQRGILNSYRADITQYVCDPEHSQRIKTIFEAIPAQLNKENRRFVVSGIDKEKRFSEMRSDFDWLVNAGVAIQVRRATEAQFPLGLNLESSFFKLYLCDVGLLFSTLSDVDVIEVLKQDDAINYGNVYENAVAQELRAHGYERLAYYRKTSIGEVDFLIEPKGKPEVLPVEVKSGARSRSHAALDGLMQVKNYQLQKAIVLHPGNVEVEDQITYLPIYMAALL